MSAAGEPQVENVPRGLLLSLVTIPAGIAAWLILWNFGFIASIVAWGIAFLASWLYRVGAGRVTRAGVVVIAGVTVVTLVLALFAGFAWDVGAELQSQYGIAWSRAIGMPAFWRESLAWMFDSSNAMTLVLAALFAFLGCFWTLRRLVRGSRAAVPAPAGPLAATPAEQIGPDQEQLPPAPAGDESR